MTLPAGGRSPSLHETVAHFTNGEPSGNVTLGITTKLVREDEARHVDPGSTNGVSRNATHKKVKNDKRCSRLCDNLLIYDRRKLNLRASLLMGTTNRVAIHSLWRKARVLPRPSRNVYRVFGYLCLNLKTCRILSRLLFQRGITHIKN